MHPLHPETLTWTALLGKWIEFAQASIALPAGGDGEKWKQSVVPVINLQAVTFALAELGDLPTEDRPLARDKAEMLITENTGVLESTWGDDQLPESLAEITRDARLAFGVSQAIKD